MGADSWSGVSTWGYMAAVFFSQSPTQCDWQGQAKAVIIPYYPCPVVNAASHMWRADLSAFIRLPVPDFRPVSFERTQADGRKNTQKTKNGC